MDIPRVYTLTYQKNGNEEEIHTFTADSDELATQFVRQFLQKEGGKFVKLKLAENT